ncbi:caffeoylshikimate esterase isoform X2 [Manihot esculenta]|uniref:caffeoylshikimate esterase isoform X2 n=1 Tax=Manihot esculenta TaxID=3983 RepID=UPI000B5D71E2|nr:caffeoylshikimate esterase isoform X2 [Manihot esculenta]
MDLSLKLRSSPSSFSLTCRKFHSPINHPLRHQLPIVPPPSLKLKPRTFLTASGNRQLTVMAKLSKSLEGVSQELNLIASQNLDHAPARRRVRSAFTQVQQQLHHPLLKWYERNSSGLELFVKSWRPSSGIKIKGAVFFCHGYGDTCTFFFEGIAKRIAAAGYIVYALDHPGFGLSEGLHGYIPSFDGLVDNIIERYARIKGRPELKGLPCFLLGQSMGGAVALKVHLKEPQAWDGIVLVAPMCRIAEDVKPPPPILKTLILLSRVMPKAKLLPQRDLAELGFRDLKSRKTAEYNVICYSDRMRLKTAVELLKATEDIEAKLDKVSSPLLILHGAADKVTDPLVSQFLYQKASSNDKTLKLYEGGYHSILEGEPEDRILAIFDDITTWLDSHCSTT